MQKLNYWIKSKIGLITLVIGCILLIIGGFFLYKYVINGGSKPLLVIDNAEQGTDYLLELSINTKLEAGMELTDEERDFYNDLLKKRKKEDGGWVAMDNGFSREELIFEGDKESTDYNGVTITLKGIKALYEKGDFRYVEVIYDVNNKSEEELYITYTDLQMDNVKFENSGAMTYVQPSETEEIGVLLMINDKVEDNYFPYKTIKGTLTVNKGDFEYGEPVIKETLVNEVTHYRK